MAPVMKFFVYPRQQAHWTIRHAVSNGLRLGNLLAVVAIAFFQKQLGTLKTSSLCLA